VMRKWSGELDAFRAWRASQSANVQADLERLPELSEPMAEDGSGPVNRSN